MIDPTPALKEIDFLQTRINGLNWKNTELQSTITAQEDIIKRLKDDGDRLADAIAENSYSGGCIYCECFNGKHSDRCVITSHTQLMNELGEK